MSRPRWIDDEDSTQIFYQSNRESVHWFVYAFVWFALGIVLNGIASTFAVLGFVAFLGAGAANNLHKLAITGEAIYLHRGVGENAETIDIRNINNMEKEERYFKHRLVEEIPDTKAPYDIVLYMNDRSMKTLKDVSEPKQVMKTIRRVKRSS